jgi:hypothetical protein
MNSGSLIRCLTIGRQVFQGTFAREQFAEVPIDDGSVRTALLPEQLFSDPPVQAVLQKLVDLEFRVFIAIRLEQGVGVRIGYGPRLHRVIGTELDVRRVAKEQPVILKMLGNGHMERFGELSNGHVLGGEPGIAGVVQVLMQNTPAKLREADDLDEHVADVVCNKSRSYHP